MEKGRACPVVKIDGTKCASTMLKTSFMFIGQNDTLAVSKTCQACSDWILRIMLLKESAIKDDIRKKKEEKHLYKKLYTQDARNGMLAIDRELEQLARDLQRIRFDSCRVCGHDLECLCDICHNDTMQKELLIVASFHNTFRHAIHLHIKCAQQLKTRLGITPAKEMRDASQTTLQI